MAETFKLPFKRLSEFAILPSRGSAFSAGYDLSSAQDCVIPARGRALVLTDLAVAIPDQYYGRVAPRSGLALRHGIDVGAGVIDSDYRGNIGVVLFNHSDQEFAIKRGDRIAQLIIEKIATPEVVEVLELPNSERGSGGFGSTGIVSNNLEANCQLSHDIYGGEEKVKPLNVGCGTL